MGRIGIYFEQRHKVFDGSVYISGTKDSWYTINFDKSFDYAGYNIIITVYDKTGHGAGNPGYHTFYVYSTSGRTLYKNNDNSEIKFIFFIQNHAGIPTVQICS